jgi:hypothetical protein
MSRHPILQRIAWLHPMAVLIAALGLWSAGLPIAGTLIGGGLIGVSFVGLWIFMRAVVEPGRKRMAFAVGVLKLLLYVTLGTAVLSGRFTPDAGGVALGVTLFVIISLTTALTTSTRPRGAI